MLVEDLGSRTYNTLSQEPPAQSGCKIFIKVTAKVQAMEAKRTVKKSAPPMGLPEKGSDANASSSFRPWGNQCKKKMGEI